MRGQRKDLEVLRESKRRDGQAGADAPGASPKRKAEGRELLPIARPPPHGLHAPDAGPGGLLECF